LARIRQDNVHHAARRHDWTYRVRTVFEQLGLPATEAMVAREAKLQALAAGISTQIGSRARFTEHPERVEVPGGSRDLLQQAAT
jgi:hypothetical protein